MVRKLREQDPDVHARIQPASTLCLLAQCLHRASLSLQDAEQQEKAKQAYPLLQEWLLV